MQTSAYTVTQIASGLVISDANHTLVSQYPNQVIYSTTTGKSSGKGKMSLLSVMMFFLALSATVVADFVGPANSNLTLFLNGNNTAGEPSECGVMHQYTPPTYFNDGESEMLVFKTDDDALSYAESLYLNTSITIELPLFVKESQSLINIVNITELPITKRWSCSSAPLGTHFTQKQNAQYGIWWGPWAAASPCFYTGNGNGGSRSIELKSCRSWSVSAGFSLDLIKGLGFDISADITTEDCKSDSWTCDEGKWAVQVWKQQQYLWADQQEQRCVREYYGNNGCKCDAWGPYIHGDVPTNTISYGCSTDNNVNCNAT